MKPKVAIAFSLPGAASPARVARAAEAIRDVVRATKPGLDEDQITMVVRNHAMSGEVRAWSDEGKDALDIAVKFLERPKPAVKSVKHGRRIARNLAGPLRVLAAERTAIMKPKAKRAIRVVTEKFVEELVQLAAEPAQPSVFEEILGSDVLVATVLRIGRLDKDAPVKARLLPSSGGLAIEEIEVPPALVSEFFDAAKSSAKCTIEVNLVWKRSKSGGLKPEYKAAVARRITPLLEPITAHSLIEAFAADAPDAFADLDETLGSIKGD